MDDPQHGSKEQAERVKVQGRLRMREWRDRKKKEQKDDLLNNAMNQPVEDDDELFEFVEEYGEQEVKKYYK